MHVLCQYTTAWIVMSSSALVDAQEPESTRRTLPALKRPEAVLAYRNMLNKLLELLWLLPQHPWTSATVSSQETDLSN